MLLIIGFTRLFGGDGGNDPKAEPAAHIAAATPTGSQAPSPAATVTVTAAPTPTPTPTEPALPEPEGTCEDEDVTITPSVEFARATMPVTISLELRTLESEACTWRFGSDSVQLKVTSGNDRIWTTVECPRALKGRNVVVRRDTPATIDVVWSSRRSDEDCSSHTRWAMPGYYHATVAVLGGEPSDVQFPLYRPTRTPPTPTATASPSAAATTPAATPSPEQGRRSKRPSPGAATATVTAPPHAD